MYLVILMKYQKLLQLSRSLFSFVCRLLFFIQEKCYPFKLYSITYELALIGKESTLSRRILVQKRYGLVRVGSEKGHKNDHRDGVPLLWGKAERGGIVCLEKRKIRGDLIVIFQFLKVRKMGKHFLAAPVAIGWGVMTKI